MQYFGSRKCSFGEQETFKNLTILKETEVCKIIIIKRRSRSKCMWMCVTGRNKKRKETSSCWMAVSLSLMSSRSSSVMATSSVWVVVLPQSSLLHTHMHTCFQLQCLTQCFKLINRDHGTHTYQRRPAAHRDLHRQPAANHNRII